MIERSAFPSYLACGLALPRVRLQCLVRPRSPRSSTSLVETDRVVVISCRARTWVRVASLRYCGLPMPLKACCSRNMSELPRIMRLRSVDRHRCYSQVAPSRSANSLHHPIADLADRQRNVIGVNGNFGNSTAFGPNHRWPPLLSPAEFVCGRMYFVAIQATYFQYVSFFVT